MREANEDRNRSGKSISSSSRSKAMESLSLEINRYPSDLLERFMSSDAQLYNTTPTTKGEDDEEIELNLGLSLGGRFGVDKNAKKLTRSSSIAGSLPVVRERDALSAQPASYPVLMRTASLPTETEEEWRKRKEMQSLRRLEAKRRRSEKQKNLRGELNLEEGKKELNVNKGNLVAPTWARNMRRGGNSLQGSQGSVESQGGISSGLSEMESKPVQGSSSGGEAVSPASYQSLQERDNQEAAGSSGTKTSGSEMENLSKRLESTENRGRDVGINAMEDMPCVFTKGEGPDGRRVEGILYKYGNGEEVRIMCVCHGSFLSPAEFVKHAGGGDVDHPLRHIVVNRSGSSFL